MGQNKDAVVGFIGIGIIIAIIVGIILVLLPGEPETVQDEIEKTQPITTQNENNIQTQDNSQKILLEKIQEQEKNLQYLDKIKQTDPNDLDFLDQEILKNEQEYRKQTEQELERLNELKQQGLGYSNIKNIQEKTELKDEKLNTEDLQKIIAGFESYNKSVKILLDACVSVESEEDFITVGQLIEEYGEEFLQTTSGYGAIRDRLMDEGYGEHPTLGPLMFQSAVLVDGMSTCMEVLVWEFSS